MATSELRYNEPTVVFRCTACNMAYYDTNFRGETCRECGALL